MSENADYVVIGAGSAGCVIASRLSEDPKVKVVLLEAGPRDWHPMIHIPAGIRSLLENPRVNWNYSSEPEEGSGGRRIHWPRGRVLGGSSSINGMLYVRGNPADYDGWAQRGCKDWGYEQVLPYFMKSEDFRGADADDEYRSRGGPLVVEDYRTVLPITDRFVQAAQQAGYPLTKDYNGAEQEGVAYSQMTRDHRFRASTAQTFLAQAKGRSNLEVKTEARPGSSYLREQNALVSHIGAAGVIRRSARHGKSSSQPVRSTRPIFYKFRGLARQLICNPLASTSCMMHPALATTSATITSFASRIASGTTSPSTNLRAGHAWCVKYSSTRSRARAHSPWALRQLWCSVAAAKD